MPLMMLLCTIQQRPKTLARHMQEKTAHTCVLALSNQVRLVGPQMLVANVE
jgi:hypothetical protein